MQNSLSKIQNTSAQKPAPTRTAAVAQSKASLKSQGISASRGIKSSIQDSVEEEEVNAYFKAAASEKPVGKNGSVPPAPGRKAGAGSNSTGRANNIVGVGSRGPSNNRSNTVA